MGFDQLECSVTCILITVVCLLMEHHHHEILNLNLINLLLQVIKTSLIYYNYVGNNLTSFRGKLQILSAFHRLAVQYVILCCFTNA